MERAEPQWTWSRIYESPMNIYRPQSNDNCFYALMSHIGPSVIQFSTLPKAILFINQRKKKSRRREIPRAKARKELRSHLSSSLLLSLKPHPETISMRVRACHHLGESSITRWSRKMRHQTSDSHTSFEFLSTSSQEKQLDLRWCSSFSFKFSYFHAWSIFIFRNVISFDIYLYNPYI